MANTVKIPHLIELELDNAESTEFLKAVIGLTVLGLNLQSKSPSYTAASLLICTMVLIYLHKQGIEKEIIKQN